MQDFFGFTLKENACVVICIDHGRNAGASFVLGEIVGFTPKMVKIKYRPPGTQHTVVEKMKHPSKVIALSSFVNRNKN